MWMGVQTIAPTCNTFMLRATQRQIVMQKTAVKGSRAQEKAATRCSFPHYGFLFIEGYCAIGIPLESVADLTKELIGPDSRTSAKATIAQVQQEVLSEFPGCTNALSVVAQEARAKAESQAAKDGGEALAGNVAAWRDRDMKTWVPNAMVEQMMIELGVRCV